MNNSLNLILIKDAIHANKRDIQNIFKIRGTSIWRTSSLASSTEYTTLLVMCQNQKEQQRWIQDLNKVHKQLKKLEPQFPLPFRFYEIYDSGTIYIPYIF